MFCAIFYEVLLSRFAVFFVGVMFSRGFALEVAVWPVLQLFCLEPHSGKLPHVAWRAPSHDSRGVPCRQVVDDGKHKNTVFKPTINNCALHCPSSTHKRSGKGVALPTLVYSTVEPILYFGKDIGRGRK